MNVVDNVIVESTYIVLELELIVSELSAPELLPEELDTTTEQVDSTPTVAGSPTDLAVMIAEPADTAVTLPFASTVAIDVFDDTHSTFL